MPGSSVQTPGRGRALYEEFKARILDGTFAPGSALPSSRACAAERGLSRTTVSAVFEQLAAEGYIHNRAGAAARVAKGLTSRHAEPARQDAMAPPRISQAGRRLMAHPIAFVQPAPAGSFDFAYGPLSREDFPTLMWAKAVRRAEVAQPSRLAYEDPRGCKLLREELARYLARSRGLQCSADQLVITNGSQQVVDLCARLLLDPGDQVAVENPGYRMAHRAFAATGARLYAVDVDQLGMLTSRLPSSDTRLAFVTPSHQFPLGSFLAAPRRIELLDWSARQNAWVIEDDYDGEYRHSIRPEQTLKSLDQRDRVIYVGTLSKTLSPRLRIGYAVLPRVLVDPFVQLKQVADRHSPTLHQIALAHLIADGRYERHVRRMRRTQSARQQALLAAIERHLGPRAAVQGAATGLHVVVWIKGFANADAMKLLGAAQQAGVFVDSIDHHFLPGTPRRGASAGIGLVMGYALLSPEQIDKGVKRLAMLLRGMTAKQAQ